MESLVGRYVIISLLCVLVIVQVGFANPVFASKTYVEINNQLPAKLTVHCKSKEDDLGIHELDIQGQWGFLFRPNFVVENTLFYCSFAWAGQVRYFDIYEQRRDEYRCKNCIWKVKPDGPCLELNKYDVCYPWNS